MALQFSIAARNAQLEAIETAIGTAPTLTIRTGTVPADCAAADAGVVLATMILPLDFLAAAASGVKAIAGAWTDAAADAAGVAAHFRIKQGIVCHLQGTAGMTGTDMIIDNSNIAVGQAVTVSVFNLTAGGA